MPTVDALTRRLTAVIGAVCPIQSINIVDPIAKTVRIDFDPTATTNQRNVANSTLSAFDWTDVAQTAWEQQTAVNNGISQTLYDYNIQNANSTALRTAFRYLCTINNDLRVLLGQPRKLESQHLADLMSFAQSMGKPGQQPDDLSKQVADQQLIQRSLSYSVIKVSDAQGNISVTYPTNQFTGEPIVLFGLRATGTKGLYVTMNDATPAQLRLGFTARVKRSKSLPLVNVKLTDLLGYETEEPAPNVTVYVRASMPTVVS